MGSINLRCIAALLDLTPRSLLGNRLTGSIPKELGIITTLTTFVLVSMAQPPEALTNLDNYHPWKLRMLEYLDSRGLRGAVDRQFDSDMSSTQKVIAKKRALDEIYERLGEEVASHVEGSKSARALWDKLKSVYKLRSKMQRVEEQGGIDAVVDEKLQHLRDLELEIKRLNKELEQLMRGHEQMISEVVKRDMERLVGIIYDGNIVEEPIHKLGRSIIRMVESALPNRRVAIQQEYYSEYQQMKNEFPLSVVVDWQVVESHLAFDITSWAPPHEAKEEAEEEAREEEGGGCLAPLLD